MSQVSDFLDNLFSTLFKDEAGVLQPVADNYLSSIIANPAPDNVLAQSLAFPVDAQKVLPAVAGTAAKDTATALKAFLDAQVPALVASTAASAAVTASVPTDTAAPAVSPPVVG